MLRRTVAVIANVAIITTIIPIIIAMTLESIMNTNVTYFLRNTCQAIERAGGNGGRPRVARPEQIH